MADVKELTQAVEAHHKLRGTLPTSVTVSKAFKAGLSGGLGNCLAIDVDQTQEEPILVDRLAPLKVPV